MAQTWASSGQQGERIHAQGLPKEWTIVNWASKIMQRRELRCNRQRVGSTALGNERRPIATWRDIQWSLIDSNESSYYCKHVHTHPSFAFRQFQWVLTRMRCMSDWRSPDTKKKRHEYDKKDIQCADQAYNLFWQGRQQLQEHDGFQILHGWMTLNGQRPQNVEMPWPSVFWFLWFLNGQRRLQPMELPSSRSRKHTLNRG